MRALILAAGYATRLREVARDRPKPLLPIVGKPMIDHLLDKLERISEIESATVVTNARFAPLFQDWAEAQQRRWPIAVLDDGTDSDANKRGAIGDILFAIEQDTISSDLFVGAGDNLFDFDLQPFFATFRERGSTVGLYDVGRLDVMPQYSEVRLDADQRIVSLVEKPAAPTSTFMATALYAYRAEHLPLFREYKDAGGNMDSPGFFPAWLHRRVPLFGYVFRGQWFDVGTPERYREANEAWGGNLTP